MNAPSTQDATAKGLDVEEELCIRCLSPNPVGTDFCGACGCPLTSFAATAPFVSIFAEGDLYRHAVEQPDRPIILAGMWLLFGTMGLVGLSMLVAQGGDALSRGTGLAMLAFSAVLLARVTLRYHALRSRRAAEPGVPHEGNRPAA